MNRQWQGLIGADEAGRGSLAGPIVAAAIRVKNIRQIPIRQVRESKLLSAEKRQEFFGLIQKACDVQYGVVSHLYINSHGIQKANVRAVEIAIKKFGPGISVAIIDYIGGFRNYSKLSNFQMYKKADRDHLVVALASIAAKVYRDNLMLRWRRKYPKYHFHQHKGYGTSLHRQALIQHGPCQIHRISFIRKLLI